MHASKRTQQTTARNGSLNDRKKENQKRNSAKCVIDGFLLPCFMKHYTLKMASTTCARTAVSSTTKSYASVGKKNETCTLFLFLHKRYAVNVVEHSQSPTSIQTTAPKTVTRTSVKNATLNNSADSQRNGKKNDDSTQRQ